MLGSTAASTALLQFELDTPLVHLARKIGKRAAGRAWACSRAAVNELRTQRTAGYYRRDWNRAHRCISQAIY